MKRIYVIISSFFILTILFSIYFYGSYRLALRNFNNHADERNGLVVKMKEIDTKMVDTTKVNTITPFTNIVVKQYDVATRQMDTFRMNVSEEMIGYTREDLVAYCAQYMHQLPVAEQKEGLLSYQVESFSESEVVLSKNYDSDRLQYEYYIVEQNGLLTVFHKDKQTVFEYTNIEIKDLPQEDIDKIEAGIYVSDKQELYTILEGYSS
ncbi:BofC C-terminal domain-containing protein [Anaerosporobacter faecicola]|uniref:BofC C-terminal domain-containing protein n=1 Tax=Anaerosporobacter faecicola TaxID=2718714 RepID=UPI00143A0312|nr:BofC C-terminal domain-containing protein [Anaerosporobacter faecicola]